MTIHLLFTPQEVQQAQQQAAPYDSIWANTAQPGPPASALDQVMLSHDKIYVVLAVVLIIWLGLMVFLFRTDRKIETLERTVEACIPEERDDF